jgi:hypothetical protein
MPYRDHAEFRPVRESSVWTAVVVVLLLLGAGALWWRWSQQQAPVQAPPAASTAAQEPAPTDMASPPLGDAGPQNPIDSPEAPLPPLANSDSQVTAQLTELFGKMDGFVRRFVATVDNLPREHAAPRMWPVHPMGKRFTVSGNGESQAIALDNGSRYAPLILMSESVDAARAAKIYAGLYPLFQQAYEELGYPGKYFNDRLVAVIDHLLRAPEPEGPLRVKLTEVKGEQVMVQPWVHYEFVDPKLESLSAGQKMMVRGGLVNERRLKARLSAFRAQIATGELAKK